MGQIEKFWCLSDREFPEFFKNGPIFYSSSTQWPSVTIFHKSQFFLGHPVYYSSTYLSSWELLICYACACCYDLHNWLTQQISPDNKGEAEHDDDVLLY